MKTAGILIGLLLILLSGLLGCSPSLLNLPSLDEQRTFARGLDQYAQTGETRILETLSQQDPKSDWPRRAETVLQLVTEQRRQAAALAKEQQELTECLQENAYLAGDNQMLEATLEKLKQLLIDMESRSQ